MLLSLINSWVKCLIYIVANITEILDRLQNDDIIKWKETSLPKFDTNATCFLRSPKYQNTFDF